MTQRPTARMNNVARALTAGFRPSRTRENTSMGSVVEPGPDRNEASTTSSSDKVNDSSQADTSAGAISGSVKRTNTVTAVTPRSSAAATNDPPRSATRAQRPTTPKTNQQCTSPPPIGHSQFH